MVQSITYNWSNEEYMQHAKKEVIEDLNNVITSFQHVHQQEQQVQQSLQQIDNL